MRRLREATLGDVQLVGGGDDMAGGGGAGRAGSPPPRVLRSLHRQGASSQGRRESQKKRAKRVRHGGKELRMVGDTKRMS